MTAPFWKAAASSGVVFKRSSIRKIEPLTGIAVVAFNSGMTVRRQSEGDEKTSGSGSKGRAPALSFRVNHWLKV